MTNPAASGAATARAVAYLRVSTDRQADSGLGLDAQRAAVTAAAERLGRELTAVHVDGGTSGAVAAADRPVLMEAINALRRGDVLLVAKRDRLGRDVIEMAMIERLIAKRGARVMSAAGEGTDADDPTALLMRRLIDSFAEYERLLIGSRTRAALAAKARRGERVGTIPYGYRLSTDGRSIEPEPAEQRTLALLREYRAAGRTLQAIADALNQQGHRTRCGSRWRHPYVRNLLLAPAKRATKAA